ncbi:hypothetical protein F5X99DRAFT_86797 [Biscogniauxia marginata]|nr:hypothetical protein F5X99DRAFT_86797 [Biscogniauxia marginata]
MAIGIQHPQQYEPAAWGLKHSITYTLEYSGLIIDTMSYQYPTLPQSGEVPHSGYISRFPAPTTSSIEGTNDAAHKSVGHSGDKKRNKLGYHRASIACVNCRNRKIRCIAPDKRDAQGQCKSCQHLKRECIYENIDQKPSSAPGQKQGSVRPSAGVSLESVSLSPTTRHRHPAEMVSHQSYQQLPTTSPVHSIGLPLAKQESYSEDPRIQTNSLGARTFGYGQGMTNWILAETNSSSTKIAGDINMPLRNYPHESPVTTGFSPYSPQPLQTSAMWPSGPPRSTEIGAEATSRPDDTWSSYPPPARLTSYGNEPPSQYLPSARSYDRRTPVASDMYQYSHTTTSMEGMPHPGTPIDPGVSLPSEVVPTSTYSTWQQPYQYSKGNESYGLWYGEQQHSSSSAEHPPPETGGLYYGGR